MAVTASDIEWRLSGGPSNAVGNLSLGAEMSSAEVANDVIHALFDRVIAEEADVGETDYRCIYITNVNDTDSLYETRLFIALQATSPTTTIEIGLAPEGIGDGENTGVAELIATELTEPTGVTWSSPSSPDTGLAIGTLGPGDAIAVWIRRVIGAGTEAVPRDFCRLMIRGLDEDE